MPELMRQRVQYLMEHGGYMEKPRDTLRLMVAALIVLQVLEVVLLAL